MIDALTIVHGTACVLGLSLSTYVLGIIVFVQGEDPHMPAMFILGCVIEVAAWLAGMGWGMNPQRYPRGFCNASAIMYNFGAFLLTSSGVSLTLTTWNAIYQARQGRFGAICRPWQIPRWLQSFFFLYPLIAVAVFATVGLTRNAFGPEGLWICDVANPDVMWLRILGYGGIDVIVTIPAFLASFSSVRNLYLIHNDANLTKSLRTYQATNFGLAEETDEKDLEEEDFGTRQIGGRAIRPQETIQISLDPKLDNYSTSPQSTAVDNSPSLARFQKSPDPSPASTFVVPDHPYTATWDDAYERRQAELLHEQQRLARQSFQRPVSRGASRAASRPSTGRASDDRAFSDTESAIDVMPGYEGRRKFQGPPIYTGDGSPWDEQPGRRPMLDRAYIDRVHYSRRFEDEEIDPTNTGNLSPLPLTTMVWKQRLAAERRDAERRSRPNTAEHTVSRQHLEFTPSMPHHVVSYGSGDGSTTKVPTLLTENSAALSFAADAIKAQPKGSSQKAGARSQPKLLHALWRIMFFDVVFTIIEILAAITSWQAIATKKAPEGYDTAFFAVVLAIWGPFIVFGSTPIVADRIFPPWRRIAAKLGF